MLHQPDADVIGKLVAEQAIDQLMNRARASETTAKQQLRSVASKSAIVSLFGDGSLEPPGR